MRTSNAPIRDFFIDFQRCIGCQSCVAACAECHTHRGISMIKVEKVDPAKSPQTVPIVCMHCRDATCTRVCPMDAVKKDENGIVHSSQKPKCMACRSCELSCPFGVPTVYEEIQQMLKCDMCFDRTSIGKKPMCATVCPSGALFYGTREEIQALRPHSKPIQRWRFGKQRIETRVHVMVPHSVDEIVVTAPETVATAEPSAPSEAAVGREFL